MVFRYSGWKSSEVGQFGCVILFTSGAGQACGESRQRTRDDHCSCTTGGAIENRWGNPAFLSLHRILCLVLGHESKTIWTLNCVFRPYLIPDLRLWKFFQPASEIPTSREVSVDVVRLKSENSGLRVIKQRTISPSTCPTSISPQALYIHTAYTYVFIYNTYSIHSTKYMQQPLWHPNVGSHPLFFSELYWTSATWWLLEKHWLSRCFSLFNHESLFKLWLALRCQSRYLQRER